LPVNANETIQRQGANRVRDQAHRLIDGVHLEYGFGVNRSVRKVPESQVITRLENGLERNGPLLKKSIQHLLLPQRESSNQQKQSTHNQPGRNTQQQHSRRHPDHTRNLQNRSH
jgi:hypothetical protein